MSLVRQILNKNLKNLDKNKACNVLLQFVINNNLNKVKSLLSPENVNTFDKHGKTLLHYATENLNIEIINLLIQNRADLNIKTKTGYTALHCIIFGYVLLPQNVKLSQILKIIDTLLENGADINLKCDNDNSPLYYGIFSGYKITRLLLKYSPDVTEIELKASQSLKSKYIKDLIQDLYNFQVKELILMSNLKSETILLDDDFIMMNILEFL